MKQKKFAVCTDDQLFLDSLNEAKEQATDLLTKSPDKTFFIVEVIGKASNGVQWDMKRTRKTKVEPKEVEE